MLGATGHLQLVDFGFGQCARRSVGGWAHWSVGDAAKQLTANSEKAYTIVGTPVGSLNNSQESLLMNVTYVYVGLHGTRG